MSRIVALVLVLVASSVASATSQDVAQAGFVKSVVDTINAPDAARAAVLLQGQKVAAIRHYEREAGVDLTTAKDVVDRLIEQGR